MSAQHTAGPWRNEGDDCLTAGFPFIAIAAGEIGPSFRSIAEVQGVYDERADGAPLTDESRANARLIASAPSLLEALQWALNELNGHNRYDEDVADQQIDACYDRAEDALASALGGTHA